MEQRILSYRKAPATQAKRSSLFHRSRVLLSSSVADLFLHQLIHPSDRGQLHLLPPSGPCQRHGHAISTCATLTIEGQWKAYQRPQTFPQAGEAITRRPQCAARSSLAASVPTEKAPFT